jgi:hypothetical protein
MMRALLLAAALLLAGRRLEAQRGRVNLPGFPNTIVLDTLAVSAQVDAPMGRLYHATVVVLENMKIPIEVNDSAGGLVGNLRLTVMRRLAGEPLSRFLNCGTSMTGPNADGYRVSAALLTILDPLPGNKTRLRVAFAAGARDIIGTSNDPVMCGSSGVFESRLIERITRLIATSKVEG